MYLYGISVISTKCMLVFQVYFARWIGDNARVRHCSTCETFHQVAVFGGLLLTCEWKRWSDKQREASEEHERILRLCEAGVKEAEREAQDAADELEDASEGGGDEDDSPDSDENVSGEAGSDGDSARGDEITASEAGPSRGTVDLTAVPKRRNKAGTRQGGQDFDWAMPPHWGNQTQVVGGWDAKRQIRQHLGERGYQAWVRETLGDAKADASDPLVGERAVDALIAHLEEPPVVDFGLPNATVDDFPAVCSICGLRTHPQAFVGKGICLMCPAGGGTQLSVIEVNHLLESSLINGKGVQSC